MSNTKQRLVELIRQSAAENGCSESQLEQILALVKATFEEGVPDLIDLRQRLLTLGGTR